MRATFIPSSVALALIVTSCSTTTVAPTTVESSSTLPAAAATTSTLLLSTTTSSTSSPSLPTDTHLLVVGDWGSGTMPQGAVSGAMDRYADANEIEAILTTGDNFYSDNSEFLMQPYGWVADRSIPWWITWGNHDVETESRILAVSEAFDSPPRWDVHEWGSVDVMILDSNQVTNLNQASFFLATMADSDRPMIIALHHPPYSCSHHGSTTEIVNTWIKTLDRDVVLVLSGHDHSYQRFEEGGVTFVVTGGGGQSIRPLRECPDNHPPRAAGAELHHFVAIEQTATSIELTAYDVNNALIDVVTIPIS